MDPSKTVIFENYTRELLRCETIDEFNDLAGRFINDFPRAERWKWFQDLIRVTKSEPLASCWHTREGVWLCDGSASEQEVILNLPVVLILEMGDTGSIEWNIPATLSPYASNPPASVAGVKYSMVGHIYSSVEAQHFIVRYLWISASKKKIFDYDGRKHEGHAIRRRTTSTRGTLTGPSQSIQGVPNGFFFLCTGLSS